MTGQEQDNIMRTNRKEMDARQLAILRRVRDKGEIRSEDIAREYGISMMTVRRDLQMLEEQGLLHRTHGGAQSIENVHIGRDISSDILACREQISRFAARYVESGDSLFINGSRTALNMLKYAEDKKVFVCTNNGWAIGASYPKGVQIRLVGGEIRDRVMVGNYTMRNLLEMNADKTFLGCAAVYDDGEFRYDIPTEIGINESMIGRTSGNIYILADHTKLHHRGERNNVYGSCTYERPVTLITDDKSDPQIIEHLREKGIEIVIVPVSGQER